MGLITKTVKIKWNQKTKKYYENLGYVYTKMYDEFEVKIEDLQKGSSIKVNCICDNCGCDLNPSFYDYNKRVKEDGKTYCISCSCKMFRKLKELKTRLNNGKSFYDWCIENNRQDLLDRWDYELNGCSPKDILYGTKNKYYFKCLIHPEHCSELKLINTITSGSKKHLNCKQCNSIAQWFIDNNLDIKDYWDYDKNTVDPWEISIGMGKKIWVKCQEKDCHGSYYIRCADFVNGHRCPKCVKEREESMYEEKTKLYLEELGYEVKTEYRCSLLPKNPKTNYPLPFDNEVILKNGKYLIIEVHGEQHYSLLPKNNNWLKNGQTPEEYLYERKLIDRYKRIKCIQAGYEYLEIPYTAFDKKETYKDLIDNKIKEILES